MKTLLLLSSILLFCCGSLFAQEPEKAPIPRFKKVKIADSGCMVYLPEETTFELSKSEDGSDVFVGEVSHGNFNFAVICVKFAETLDDPKGFDDMLTAYMNFIQDQFGITASAGYGKGHTLESNPAAKGIIDYWMDAEGNDWAVKGWIDSKYLAVLMLYGEGEYPYYNVQDMFLNGFRFPEK